MRVTSLLQSLISLHLLHCGQSCLGGFRYHPTDAATAKRKSEERLEAEADYEGDYEGDYYYDYDYSVRDDEVVIVEDGDEETGRLRNATRCGRKGGSKSGVVGHVVGGAVARNNELPWHVSMLRSHEGWAGCSAALLSCDPVVVVTAAHCVE